MSSSSPAATRNGCLATRRSTSQAIVFSRASPLRWAGSDTTIRSPIHLASEVLRRRVLVRISTSGRPRASGVWGAGITPGSIATRGGSGLPGAGSSASVQSKRVISLLWPMGVTLNMIRTCLLAKGVLGRRDRRGRRSGWLSPLPTPTFHLLIGDGSGRSPKLKMAGQDADMPLNGEYPDFAAVRGLPCCYDLASDDPTHLSASARSRCSGQDRPMATVGALVADHSPDGGSLRAGHRPAGGLHHLVVCHPLYRPD